MMPKPGGVGGGGMGGGGSMSGGGMEEPSPEQITSAIYDTLDQMSKVFGQQGVDFEDVVSKWLGGKTTKPTRTAPPAPPSGSPVGGGPTGGMPPMM